MGSYPRRNEIDWRRAVLVASSVIALGAGGCGRFKADVEMHDGAVCFHRGDLQCAADHYTKATDDAPALEAAWLNLAYTYWSMYSPDDPSVDSKAAEKGCTEAFQGYLRVHEENAAPDDPQWVKDDENARGLMVQMWEQSKDFQPAIAYFEDRLKANPTDDLALVRLGELNQEAGNWKQALDWFNRRAELNANAPPSVRADIYYTIGTACFSRLHNHPEINGQERVDTSDEGLDGLMRAQGLRPDHGPTYVYINLLYRERALGEPDAVRRDQDMKEAEYYYNYSKWMMTRVPSSQPTQASASQASASQAAQASATQPATGGNSSASQPTPLAAAPH
jgi:tetratricopeptide (TPR) repeat protein